MNPKIASRVRRRLLVAGAGALSFPVVSLAVAGPNPVVKAPALPAQTLGQLIKGFAAESVEGHGDAAPAWEGEGLVLSGRLTGLNGEAIARAAIGLTATGMTTHSDADGRFMFVTTAPASDHLDLQVITPSGQTLQEVVPLLGSSCASGPEHSLASITRSADQRVRRSSVCLSITT